MPRTEHAVLGGLPSTSSDFHDFRTHESRIRIDGPSGPPRKFIARVSAFVATAEDCTGCGSIFPAADIVFASVLAIPIEGGPGDAQALAAATITVQSTPLSRTYNQETDSTATTGSTVSASASPGTPALPSATPPSGRTSTRTRRRTATTTGSAPRCSYLDDPGPIKLPLLPALYTTSTGTVRGSWHFQVYDDDAFRRGSNVT